MYTSVNFFIIFWADVRSGKNKTEKTWFWGLKADICFKNVKKIHRSVYFYEKWPWICPEFFESICASDKSLKFSIEWHGDVFMASKTY